ncbi:MAG TPA: bacteriohemerythrin [Spirochaetota bacterium]
MEFITWSDQLSVGVKHFDEEHKKLISFVNDLNHALVVGSAQKTMGDILHNLLEYTKIHFRHEEEYMLLHDYGNFAAHKGEHDALASQVVDFYDRFKSGKGSFSIELLIFLRDWLVNHIQGTDMKYRAFFESKNVR